MCAKKIESRMNAKEMTIQRYCDEIASALSKLAQLNSLPNKSPGKISEIKHKLSLSRTFLNNIKSAQDGLRISGIIAQNLENHLQQVNAALAQTQVATTTRVFKSTTPKPLRPSGPQAG